jgi:endonuclease YncB( thermonuclease family)
VHYAQEVCAEHSFGLYDRPMGRCALVTTPAVAASLLPWTAACGDTTTTAVDSNSPPVTSNPATSQTTTKHHLRRHHGHGHRHKRQARATVGVGYVIDGDTIALAAGAHVRFLQIDTPELSSDECYATRARGVLESLLPAGSRVTLRKDPALDQVDRYGRLLRYVYRGGSNLNVQLVRRGAAAPYFYGDDRGRFAGELYSLALAAKRAHRGLWGACPGTLLRPDEPVTTLRAQSSSGGGGSSGGSCEPGYTPCLPITSDLDCGDISDSLKPIHVSASDPYRLDADGDGLGCE